MKIRLWQLRKIIREAIEECGMDEGDLEEDEFTYAIAKAADKGEKTADVGGEKFPVKMSKDKAKKILGKSQQKNQGS
jgi:hypothetical protein